jgi:hypothetical protein
MESQTKHQTFRHKPLRPRQMLAEARRHVSGADQSLVVGANVSLLNAVFWAWRIRPCIFVVGRCLPKEHRENERADEHGSRAGGPSPFDQLKP